MFFSITLNLSQLVGDVSISGPALGDVLARGAAKWGNVAGNTSATRKFFRQVGNGAASALPAWDTLQASDIPDLSATYQPLDGDLTAIAALSTTAFGRALLTLLDAAAMRTAAGLGTLATQSGTFSGTSSGTNTGDQDLSGYATKAGTLAQFAATTSAQLAGVLSDETGSGSAVFSASPTLTGTVMVAAITATGLITTATGVNVTAMVLGNLTFTTNYGGAGNVVISAGETGGAGIRLGNNVMSFCPTYTLGWRSSSDLSVGSVDTTLTRSAAGKIALNSSAGVSKILTATATLDFSSTNAATASDLTITVTGAVLGDTVFLGVPNGSQQTGGVWYAWVSASDTVTVRYYNGDASSHDPASGTFRVAVMQF